MNITKIDIYNQLTNEDLDYIINNQIQRHIIHDNLTPCIFTDYATNESGRPQVRYMGRKYYLALVIALYNRRNQYDDYEIVTGFEASHLCNEPSCVNTEHIVLEHSDVNKSRICCRLYSHLKNYWCPHIPRCNNLYQ
jgi:hypothetical protein